MNWRSFSQTLSPAVSLRHKLRRQRHWSPYVPIDSWDAFGRLKRGQGAASQRASESEGGGHQREEQAAERGHAGAVARPELLQELTAASTLVSSARGDRPLIESEAGPEYGFGPGYGFGDLDPATDLDPETDVVPPPRTLNW